MGNQATTTNLNYPSFYPRPQGLYHPAYEKDACGMGFVAHIKGQRSRTVIDNALTLLTNMSHRGAAGSEINTGDGAGLSLQIPHQFFDGWAIANQINLPARADYGVGMLFLPTDAAERLQCKEQLEAILEQAGMPIIAWRTVPINASDLGATAIEGMPFIEQCFIGKPTDLADSDPLAFERRLYIARRQAEKQMADGSVPGGKCFYAASFSSRTIVYKGMLLAEQLSDFYPDLIHPEFQSAIALVHSRFSTNTFPSWERAHPYRYVIHNGEINTLRGNENWMRAREASMASPLFGDQLDEVLPVIEPAGSDTAKLDNVLEFLMLAGRSLPEIMMMMVPEPWSKHKQMDPALKAYYTYQSGVMEPWDGPAAIGFTDGIQVGAILDRNGLRPSRYYVTDDDFVIMASEVGVVDVPAESIIAKGRIQPGRMFLIDTANGTIIDNDQYKADVAAQAPYETWLESHQIELASLPNATCSETPDSATILRQQQAFGYTFEDLRLIVAPMAELGKEAIGSMGDDTPPAVLSKKGQLLFNYFKQLFAQVTNPPIDAIRESLITATESWLGSEGNLLDNSLSHNKRIRLPHPILTNEDFSRLQQLAIDGFEQTTLSTVYTIANGAAGLAERMEQLYAQADAAIANGTNLLILSDRAITKEDAPLPSLLATAGLHHHLIAQGTRVQVSLIIESGEAREVHHFATLLGYGADAINPYLALDTIGELIDKRLITIPRAAAEAHYVKATVNGIVKILSKMGISTIQSYRGAQIFEALGLNKELVDRYFSGTPSRIEGVGLDVVAAEVAGRHQQAYAKRPMNSPTLEVGGRYQFREGGEQHLFNPATIHNLQEAVRNGDYAAFKRYSAGVNDHNKMLGTLRGLLKFKPTRPSITLDEVESLDSIFKRFKSGAMSYGSISEEAHEAIAIGMNRIGGKSNSGEGGEDPARFVLDSNGDLRNSAIKQVASGRFGVTSAYLSSAQEIQIKMAQGAKPGEGGQLPGHKVYPWIAKVRHSTTGVPLISPPPHHDIYSIEDLAQLIFDLKNANPAARINVKLVSEVGVGTIAAGVAKGHADVILISGGDGGTGAAPLTSVKHAGLPWELGVAEAHQTLLLNNLRSRVVIETDGQLKTGRDVVIATLLGAEEYGFATSPLVALGCIMMRVCQLNTCPVGIATQDPELRKRFTGKPEHIENFMRFVAMEVRELMAELGFATIDEMVGQTECLETRVAIDHWKTDGIDLSSLLHMPAVGEETGRYHQIEQQHNIENTLDYQTLLPLCQPALTDQQPVMATLPITNINRATGTLLGHHITQRYGGDGLPNDTIKLDFNGSAGQSFAAFTPKGLTMKLIGDANDYFGKGLSGAKLIAHPPKGSQFVAAENIIIGNVALYGATNGSAYISGIAGERFCVRNSGATAVVEGIGDHGCEYMTGGCVVILGKTGRNFAAGMSGGIAFVYDVDGQFTERCNLDMVSLSPITNEHDSKLVKTMVRSHLLHTGSQLATQLLDSWELAVEKFVKVTPNDYERMQQAIFMAQYRGLEDEQAQLAAFRSTHERFEDQLVLSR